MSAFFNFEVKLLTPGHLSILFIVILVLLRDKKKILNLGKRQWHEILHFFKVGLS